MEKLVENRMRTALMNNELTLGTWIQIGHPAIAEILAGIGYDWICVDMEHGAIDLETMTHVFRAIEVGGSIPVVRLPKNDPIWIRRSLDAGAMGLIIPMVNSAEEADAAIRCAKYPPRGERGYGYSRANRYGMEFEESIGSTNDSIALIAQIEHRTGIENIDAILQVPDVDGVFIGPLDLSGSYGKSGQLDCPEMKDALRRYLDACEKHHKCAGIHIVRPDDTSIKNAVEQGYRMIALGVDGVFLEMASKNAMSAARN
jgi:2-keto-3-deoxy-L-rhamnonate aldolase RhmA